MTEGGTVTVRSDEKVVGASEVRRLEDRVRELERLLGGKTMEVEILRAALEKAESKERTLRLLSAPRDGCYQILVGESPRSRIFPRPG